MKAVISTGSKQYLVAQGDVIDVELLKSDKKTVSFEPLLLITDKETLVGTPVVMGHTVSAEILGESKDDKVTAIRYKAKKRVHKVHGHRQRHSQIKISSIK